MRKLLLPIICISLFISATFELKSQILYPVSLDEKINNSSVIIEGKVIDQNSFWNDQHTMIYTSNTIEVNKSFKGDNIPTTIEVLTVGGTVGLENIEASDLLTLEKGNIGTFFCYPNTINLKSPVTNVLLYDVYSSAQGCLKYDYSTKTANAPFARYADIQNQLYPELIKKTGQQPKILKDNSEFFKTGNNQKVFAPSITSFLPLTVNAGALLDPATNLFTIKGTGFGLPEGMAAILFDDANDGSGGTAFEVSYNSPLVQSWTDNQIVVRVPGRAGTGTFQVRDAGGVIGNSPSPLTVGYSIFTAQFTSGITVIKESNLMSDNGAGGYTILYSTNTNGSGINFDTDPAKITFQRALTTWKEIVGANIVEGGTTTNQVVTPGDGLNVIMFDNTNTGNPPLPSGQAAVCYSLNSMCLPLDANEVQKTQFDIVIRNSAVSLGNTNFVDGPCPPGINFTIDLETIILHELGHALNLGHINDSHQGALPPNVNPAKLMNYSTYYAVSRKSLDVSAYTGALYSITPQNNTYGNCGLSNVEMTPLITTVSSNDNCPLVFPINHTPDNTVIDFDLVHTTSNKFVDPQYTAVNCAGTGTHVTNNAYYAMKTNNDGGDLIIAVSGYGTVPASVQNNCAGVGVRLALYQVNSCPTGQAFPAPVACRTFNSDGVLATINGLAPNTNYLIYVDGIDNTKASFSLTLSGASTLPVSMLTFTGEISNGKAVLNWKTAEEINTKEFIVEKSTDGNNFSSLGAVAAKGGNSNYDLIDPSPLPGYTYYRLKIMDHDNTYAYSNIVKLKMEGQPLAITKIFPNPVQSDINIEIVSDKKHILSVEVFDMAGSKVAVNSLAVEIGLNELSVSLARLSAGSYVVQIRNEKGNILKKEKIIKE